MRRMLAIAAIAAGLAGNAAGQTSPADRGFFMEVEPLLTAAACVQAEDAETIMLLAVMLNAARLRHYGPSMTAADIERTDRLTQAADVMIRASMARDPHGTCFAAGRRLERVLAR